jgi:tRNA (guanine37-N1)-methyltransferase
MEVDIISIVPDLLDSPFSHSIMKRAEDKGILKVKVHDLRPYGLGVAKQVYDYQYGGGAGMVMMCEPLDNIITDLKSQKTYDHIIYVTPDGQTYNQQIANRLSMAENIMIICGHYKGVDQRIRDLHVTMEISIGDYVLSGGELAAAVIVDSIGRLIPGVLNNESSALFDSFQDDLLAPPIYTRPATFKDKVVPQVLLSGHDVAIEEWRTNESIQRTKERRPDIFKRYSDA